jgi:hypothetical protein
MSTILSLFPQEAQPGDIVRKDSGVAGVVEQLNKFKGFGGGDVREEIISYVDVLYHSSSLH